MAEKIELQIVADNSQYISSTKQVEQATISMHRTVQESEKRQKGLIEDTTEALKKFEEQRKKAYTIEEIEKYNKKIAEAKQTLNEYDKAGIAVEKTAQKQAKSTNTLVDGLKKLVLAYVSVNAAIKIFNAVMNSTQRTGDALKREITGIKFAVDELARSMANGDMKDFFKRLAEARQTGKEYADSLDNIGDRERELMVRESERKIQLAELATIYRNTALTGAEGYAKRAEAAEKYINLVQEGEKEAIELANIRLETELSQARQAMGLQEEYKKATDEGKKAINEQIIANIKGQRSFEANTEAINKYLDLKQQLEEAEKGTIEYRKVGDELLQVRGQKDVKLIEELNKAISETPQAVVEISDEYVRWGNVTDATRTKIASAIAEVNNKQAEAIQSTIRANTAMEMANARLTESEEKSNEERKKQAEKFSQELLKLWDEYNTKRIETLTGVEQIEAEEAFTIELINNEQKKLEELGEINEEGIKMLEALRLFAHQKALIDIRDYNAEQLAVWEDTYRDAGDKLIDSLNFRKDLELQALELSGKETEAKRLEIENKYLAAQRDLYLKAGAMYDPMMAQWVQGLIDANEKVIASSGFNFWESIGINDPKSQDAIKEGLNALTGALDEVFEARVEDAQRTRELLDTQISETQQALEAEMELMQAGYANNVEAKRKELEALKKQREAALREEEKALKAQRALDTAMQVTSLITASANIIKSFSGAGVLGVVLSIAAIAAMFATFAAAQTQATKAAKLAKGGYGDETGVVIGQSHAQGGERFTDHIEVERGEMWGVLNRKATQKYGKDFKRMVTSFNKDNLVIESSDVPINNILVDVNQTNERLDRVQYELIKLNRHFGHKKEIKDMPNMRIEKIGNKTRIIRK